MELLAVLGLLTLGAFSARRQRQRNSAAAAARAAVAAESTAAGNGTAQPGAGGGAGGASHSGPILPIPVIEADLEAQEPGAADGKAQNGGKPASSTAPAPDAQAPRPAGVDPGSSGPSIDDVHGGSLACVETLP